MPSPAVSDSDAGVYVSPVTASLSTTSSATYHLVVTGATGTTSQELPYDEIFELTISDTDAVAILNQFTVAGVQLNHPSSGYNPSSTCASTPAGAAVLKTILETAVSVGSKTPQQYLLDQLNSVINGALTSSQLSYNSVAVASNIANFPTIDLAVSIDQTTGAIVLDTTNASTDVANTALASDTLIDQVPYSTLVLYEDNANGINTSALPLKKGDFLVFGVVTAPADITLTPTAAKFASGSGAGDDNIGILGAGFTADHVADKIESRTLAFKVQLGSGGGAFTGLKA
jgi:hypothetical protein